MRRAIEWSSGQVAKWQSGFRPHYPYSPYSITLARCLILPVLALCVAAFGAPIPKPYSPSPIPYPRVVRGQVLDSRTRAPVALAAVVAGSGVATYADGQGRFELAVVADDDSLEFSHVGYQSYQLAVPAADTDIAVLLVPIQLTLREVLISAFRIPTPVSQSGPVSVLAGDALHSRARLSADEALWGQTSVGIRDYANLSTMSLRGASAEQTLVMFDGVPLNSSQDNLADLTALPLVFAERIEVVRGANSALYGANALGGLINVISPTPETLSASVRAGLGSLGRRYAAASHTDRHGPFGYVLAGNLHRTGPSFSYPDSAGETKERVNSDLSGAALLAKAAFRDDVSLLASYVESRRGIPGPVSWPSDSARMNDGRLIVQATHLARFSAAARLETKAFLHRFHRAYHDPDPFWPTSDTHTLSTVGLTLKQTAHLPAGLVSITGLEGRYENLRSTAIGRPELLAGDGWTQLRAGVGPFTFIPILRLDFSGAQDTGAGRTSRLAFSPKLAVIFSPVPELDLYASAGRSFRHPTFNELYWPEGPWTRGNPSLKPEWATGADLQATGRLGAHATCRLGAWYSHMTDLIQWQPDTAFVFTPVNLDTATITGIEAELATSFRNGGISGTVTLMDARSHGKELTYRPRYSLGVEHWLKFGPLGLNWDVRHVGPRYTDADNTDRLPGFLLLDAGLSLAHRFGPARAALRGGVRNIFDRRYQVMKDYPVPGRTLYCELETGL